MAGKQLTCSSYSKHFVWGLGPGWGGAPHSREEAGIGGGLGFPKGWAMAPCSIARKEPLRLPGTRRTC